MFTIKGGLSTDLSTIIPQRRSIIVIIVHFGSKKDTEKLVELLKGGTRPPDTIVVVDNTIDNVGYIAGLRAGVLTSRKEGYRPNDVLILLNNDLQVEPGFVSEVERWWSARGSDAMLAGPTIGRLSLFSGRTNIQGTKKRRLAQRRYVHGSCIVVERAFFDEISRLEDFFMYWEDVSMSFKAIAIGGSLEEIPITSIHHDDLIGALSDEKLYYLVRNGAYVLERATFPWSIYWMIMNPIRYAYHRLLKHAVISQALNDRKNII